MLTGVPLHELLDVPLHEPEAEELTLIFNKQVSAEDVEAVSEVDLEIPEWEADNHRLF